MRRTLLGLVLALGFTGMAHAADFIVVNSNDPGIKRGEAYEAGARLPLGAGKTLTLMRASGEVMTIKGGPSGAVLPGAKLAAADTARFDALRALVAPPPEGRTFGARRGGICALPESLLTMDDIVYAADHGCQAQARIALQTYLDKAQNAAPAN
jgi:hypothetical protein